MTEPASISLDNSWAQVCQELGISKDKADKWLQFVRESYSSGVCYDVKYLEFKLGHWNKYKQVFNEANAVYMALIFQSIVYNTKSADNADKCIEVFRRFSTEAGINEAVTSKVVELIELSVINSTDEHKNPDLFGEQDCHYFLDINMGIWATDWEKYSEFCGKTRKEYEFLNDTAYVSLRLKVLRSLLTIPNLFATKELRSQFEEKARDNIKKEINSLN